jgi:hypothetical protein
MIALGELSPIDSARARLQEQIGNFLQGRARLDRLMNSPSLVIKGQAQGLYAVQTALENRLQNEITPIIQKVSTGVWDASDIIPITGFTMSIVKQLNDVGNLERAAGISGPVGSGFGFDITTALLGAGIILGLGLMGGVFFGRRPIA